MESPSLSAAWLKNLPSAYKTQKASVEKTWGFIDSELQFFWVILYRRRHPH